MQNSKILFWSVVVALAGFLFGFDTVVISGADIPLQKLWGRGELFHGLVVMASALWGTVAGALFGGIPTDRLGRKTTLLWIGVFYFVSALGSALVSDPWVFASLRFLGGIAVGVSTIAAPTYISEIAPAADRGKLVATYQFNIVFGILVAFLSNYLLSGMGENAWRWMIGVEALPAFIYTLLVLGVPRSPRWLLTRGKQPEEAKRVLALIHPGADAGAMMAEIAAEDQRADSAETIFQTRYRFPLLLAFLLAAFNQFSGINAFLYYAPRIFEAAGLEQRSALLSSVGIGVVNLVFTLLGLALIDRFGRRQLMYIGSVGYIISLSMVALAFGLGWQGWYVPGFLFVFIAAHAIGQGTVIWVFLSEIFPNHLRASGTSFGTSVHWVLAAIIPSLVPVLFSTVGTAPVFAFFAFMMVLQLLFVWRMMPETKGIPLEALGTVLKTNIAQ
ncbi:sugar porter family MFS transporter [Neolewinella lacunae]|uniref:Sugar porter family MFS transporter n=1 Tax=Neolewinella lacunae TaxID=1517758 RepID=A0A923PGX3_9BACT|nr:sugar porter family MFS transporter [Neolewinella lacunae]MBC6993908.1 sugar porter family MFS transporter [Neolewinella lacunae]MDN3635010.1 sugar porter family MFS transporter [Neolewinella lacunae]